MCRRSCDCWSHYAGAIFGAFLAALSRCLAVGASFASVSLDRSSPLCDLYIVYLAVIKCSNLNLKRPARLTATLPCVGDCQEHSLPNMRLAMRFTDSWSRRYFGSFLLAGGLLLYPCDGQGLMWSPGYGHCRSSTTSANINTYEWHMVNFHGQYVKCDVGVFSLWLVSQLPGYRAKLKLAPLYLVSVSFWVCFFFISILFLTTSLLSQFVNVMYDYFPF